MDKTTTGVSPAGLIRRTSAFGFTESLARLERAVERHGLTVFGRIDHAAAARDAGLRLPDTTVLLAGAPRVGTPLMAEHPWLAIDLPLRILVHDDGSGRTAVGANDPGWLMARHGLDADDPPVRAMQTILAAVLADAMGDLS